MPPTLPSAAMDPPARVPPSEMLQRKLAALRHRHVTVAITTGLATLLVVGIELLALAMFVDWWLDLPWVVRLLLLCLHLGVAAYIVRRFILHPLWRQPDDDDLALMVERSRHEFRTRLIAAVQLTRPEAIPAGVSRSLVEATVEQTEAMAQPLDFSSLVPTDKMKKLVGLAAMVFLLAAIGLGFGGAGAFDLLKRVFLSNTPVPRKTRVFVRDGNFIVGRGDDVRLEAYAKGLVPSKGTIEVKYANRRTQRFPLEVDRADRSHFGRTIQNVQESFNYAIHLNDGRSGTFQVKAIARPTVASIDCQQQYPSYTGLPSARRPLGDLTLLAGSKLQLKLVATKPIRSGAIKMVGSNVTSAVPLTVNEQQPTELAGEFGVPASGLSGFSIQLTDHEGMESRDSAVYRVEILPDKVPAARITYPDRKEELVTQEARMIVGMDVSDDFEIAALSLRYKTDRLENGAPQTVELDLGGEHPRRVQRQFIWNLGSLSPRLAEGSLIEYWIEAKDNNDATGPGIGASEHQVAKVVSETEKRADLLNRAGDVFSSINDATADQELINRRLGAIILEKTGPR